MIAISERYRFKALASEAHARDATDSGDARRVDRNCNRMARAGQSSFAGNRTVFQITFNHQ